MTHILVVDDSPENCYLLRSLLEGHGYQVSEAADGRQALTLARQQPPELVISDLLMPVMDGYSLLREWRSDQATRGIPFIVYTATYTNAEDEHLAFSLGADAFLLKPAEPRVLLQALHRTLRGPVRHGLAADQVAANLHELEFFQSYSQTLVRKLEERSKQLEVANRSLEADISRRMEIEGQLRESEERFRLLVQVTTDAAWDLDLKRGLRWWGEGLDTVFGQIVPSPDQGERQWKTWVHPDDLPELLKSRAQALRNGGRWSASYRLKRGNGAWAHVEDRGYVILDSRGQAVRMVGGINDVTREVALRTQAGRSQRLEAVGQLTGGVAHDFNNLLTVVAGNAQLLAELAEGHPALAGPVQLILRAADRGASLTRQLLAFASRQVLAPQGLSLENVLDDVLPLLRSAAGNGVSLERASASLPADTVRVDPVQLESALVNLVVNARDAMKGVGIVALSLVESCLLEDTMVHGQNVAAGQYVGIEVADSGPGVSETIIDRIFEPFFTTKAIGEGSGLGLAMAFGFVRQSGGFIQLLSVPGQGATFRLFFPLAHGEPEAVVPSAHDTAVTPLGNGERILLVEDEALVRDVVAGQLEALGYRVDAKASAAQALQHIDAGAIPDLLLTDLLMPGMGGQELAVQVRQRVPGLPVLCATGYQGYVDISVLSAPRSGVLQKPFRRDDLARELRRLLRSGMVGTG